MIQANKTKEPLKLNKAEAERYVVKVWHTTPDGYPVRNAPVRKLYYTAMEWRKVASKLALIGKGYEVLHDPTIKAVKPKAKVISE